MCERSIFECVFVKPCIMKYKGKNQSRSFFWTLPITSRNDVSTHIHIRSTYPIWCVTLKIRWTLPCLILFLVTCYNIFVFFQLPFQPICVGPYFHMTYPEFDEEKWWIKITPSFLCKTLSVLYTKFLQTCLVLMIVLLRCACNPFLFLPLPARNIVIFCLLFLHPFLSAKMLFFFRSSSSFHYFNGSIQRIFLFVICYFPSHPPPPFIASHFFAFTSFCFLSSPSHSMNVPSFEWSREWKRKVILPFGTPFFFLISIFTVIFILFPAFFSSFSLSQIFIFGWCRWSHDLRQTFFFYSLDSVLLLQFLVPILDHSYFFDESFKNVKSHFLKNGSRFMPQGSFFHYTIFSMTPSQLLRLLIFDQHRLYHPFALFKLIQKFKKMQRRVNDLNLINHQF